MRRVIRTRKTVVCRCGERFSTSSGAAKWCERCSRERQKLKARMRYWMNAGKIARDEVGYEFRRAWEIYLAGRRNENRRKDLHSRRCPYCGRVVKKGESAYCGKCVEQGYHWLHMETGRTNGWDKAEKRRRLTGSAD